MKHQIFHLFCPDGEALELTSAAEQGDAPSGDEQKTTLIRKTILRTGTWKLRPSPSGPQRKPLKVFRDDAPAGHISLTELKKNFEAGAIDHVTVPLNHEDKVDENTGYVRALHIKDNEDGSSDLQADIEFTEPEIEGKVKRRSIPNVSAGVLFDFIHKQTGKKFKQVLAHVCLTGKPWINGMAPFGEGVTASDEFDAEEVVSFEFDDEPAEEPDDEVDLEAVEQWWTQFESELGDDATNLEDAVELAPKNIKQGQRKNWAASGVALPDGSFPIPNTDYLKRALKAIGRAAKGKVDKVKAHIKKRAKALGATGMLKNSKVFAADELNFDTEEQETEEPGEPPESKPKSGDTVWTTEEGTGWIRAQINQQLDQIRNQAAVANPQVVSPYYRVSDVAGNGNTGKALIMCGYGDDAEAWVAQYEIEDGELELDSQDEWVAARSEWVAAAQELDFDQLTPDQQAVYDRIYKRLISEGKPAAQARAMATQAAKNA